MIILISVILLAWTPSVFNVNKLPDAENTIPTRDGPEGIPVLLYHHVSDPVNGYYGISTSRFRNDLELLYRAGFCLVNPADIENGLTGIPPDRRPVMLTFDDGWRDNFSVTIRDNGSVNPDPECVVAILEEYCDSHPEFGHGAVFFISWDKVPFGQEEFVTEKLNMLLDLGYTIGNHTSTHRNFSALPPHEWEKEVINALEKFGRYLGLRTCMVTTLAYPGGRLPRISGVFDILDGMEYRGRRAVTMGFLVDGSVTTLSSMLSPGEERFRIGRLDMSRYSVGELLQWRNLMGTGGRNDLHARLNAMMVPVSALR